MEQWRGRSDPGINSADRKRSPDSCPSKGHPLIGNRKVHTQPEQGGAEKQTHFKAFPANVITEFVIPFISHT